MGQGWPTTTKSRANPLCGHHPPSAMYSLCLHSTIQHTRLGPPTPWPVPVGGLKLAVRADRGQTHTTNGLNSLKTVPSTSVNDSRRAQYAGHDKHCATRIFWAMVDALAGPSASCFGPFLDHLAHFLPKKPKITRNSAEPLCGHRTHLVEQTYYDK